MRFAYFDCFSGISGDMILGALMDLGVPQDVIETQVRKLPLHGFHLEARTEQRMGVHGKRVEVIVDDAHPVARSYRDIRSLIKESGLSEQVKGRSLEVFAKLADVEAHIHGRPKDEVHFHEIGGVDTIVDVVGVFVGIEWLGIETVAASELPVGAGFVTCAHGTLPVPAPATVALLKGVPVYGTGIPHELVTPTGAAIITSLARSFGPMPKMLLGNTGYGVGTRELDQRPNLLRIVLGDVKPALETDSVTVVETNIDDMNPEIFGYVMERLFEDGALDVVWIPVFMKKNRPGTMIKVICGNDDRDRVARRILSETTATGVRYYETGRTKLSRKVRDVATSLGDVQVKEIVDPSGRVFSVPEYEACKRIALEKKIPLKVVYETVVKEALQ